MYCCIFSFTLRSVRKGEFDIVDVCDSLNAKLIFRHPHVFGNVVAEDSETVVQNWEALKLKEKGGNKTVLAGVPSSLPALIKAFRVQEKVAHVGFDWEKPSQVWDKVREELSEFESEASVLDADKMEEEMGDVFLLWSMPHVSTVSILRMLSNGPTASL